MEYTMSFTGCVFYDLILPISNPYRCEISLHILTVVNSKP